MSPRKPRDFLAEGIELALSTDGRKYLLQVAATLLRVLSDPSHTARDAKHVREGARAIADALGDIPRQWQYGEILYADDALGWRRPPRWNRKAAQRRARYKHLAAKLVREALAAGAVTPDVFQDVRDSGRFPPTVSASQIRDWYYEAKGDLPEIYGNLRRKHKRREKSFQTKTPKLGKNFQRKGRSFGKT
jgi:hypothetical protein